MKNIIKTFFIASLALLSACQQGSKNKQVQETEDNTDASEDYGYEMTDHYQEFRWDQVEMTRDEKFIEQFIDKNKSSFPQFFLNPDTFDEEDLIKSLHLIDMNGDGLRDLVFNGFSGGEADYVQFFLNKEDTFLLVFEDMQSITSIKQHKGKVIKFSVDDPGCCGALLLFEKDYTIDYKNDTFIINKVRQSVLFHDTQKPSQFFDQPEEFYIGKDTLYLRNSPASINEPFDSFLEQYGNIIATYRKGDRGRAIASHIDTSGKKWLFVIMFPESEPLQSIFHNINEFPTFTKGWINSEGIDSIEDTEMNTLKVSEL